MSEKQINGVNPDQGILAENININTLLQIAPYGMFIIDLFGNILFASEMALKRLGKGKDEVLGTPLADSFPIEVAEIRRQKGIEAINSGIPQKIEDHVEERWYFSKLVPIKDNNEQIIALAVFSDDITERKHLEQEREKLISDLKEALSKVKLLSGLLPLCSHCKKIRDDKGYWNQIDTYIQENSDADISHGICPDCAEKYYPEMDLYGDDKNQG